MTQRRVLGWVLVIVCSFMTSCRSDGGSPLMAFGGNDGSIEVASSSVDVAGLPGLEGDGRQTRQSRNWTLGWTPGSVLEWSERRRR